MSRWNIASIFFLGFGGARREVTLMPGAMNIITGASGTGKSALIKAIDYCLGSGQCELPAHIRRRSVAVGVKWVHGSEEIVVGRIIPPVGQATSTQLFVTTGRNLPIPATVSEFVGPTNLESAKAQIERAFGIGDLGGEAEPGRTVRGRATVRHATPYLFVTKEVIDSETVLLHGLERADKAPDLVASMPYFLGAIDDESAVQERQLKQLQRMLDREEAKASARAKADTALRQRAFGLLVEAGRLGLTPPPAEGASETELLASLQQAQLTPTEANAYPGEGEIAELQRRRASILADIEVARGQLRAARAALRDANGFEAAVTRQHKKLALAEHLNLQKIAGVCPVCEAPSEKGRETAQALLKTLDLVRTESAAIERVQPRLAGHEIELQDRIRGLNNDLREVDGQIRSWLQQSEDTRRLASLAQAKAHLQGRVSYFLEASAEEPRQSLPDLNVLRAQIAELEAQVDRESKRIKLRRAETKISQFASDILAQLPTVAPCVGSELEFTVRGPEVVLIEADSDAVLRMPDVGSDQNYLAIHIALSFALQRHFEAIAAPVPGLLVLDQISRPYFPARDDDADEREIAGGQEDEDIQAMRRHLEFLFAEIQKRTGLQVLLIEHAYFADDPRYVNSTRERWTRASGRALIPHDWPVRPDV
jgi:hypothetical protein